MDIFVGYTKFMDIKILGATLDSWEKIEGCTPAAIECQADKYEFFRRRAAEGLAQGDYILADIGCIPKSQRAIQEAVQMLYLENGSTVGMVGVHGVRVCRKGVVDKWPARQTNDYDFEHKQAYEMKGYKVVETPHPIYKRI